MLSKLKTESRKTISDLESSTLPSASTNLAEGQQEDAAEATNLDNVLTHHEEVRQGVERPLADKLDKAFAPCRIFLLALFRFPLLLSVRPDYSRMYDYSWKSFRGWMFFITGAFMLLNAVIILITLSSIMLSAPPQPKDGYRTIWREKGISAKNGVVRTKTQEVLRLEELYLLQRNFIPILIVLLSLAHICTGDITLFSKKDFVAKYFTFWDEAVEIMQIDAATYPENVRKFMVRTVTFYVTIMTLFIIAAAVKLAPMATGSSVQLAILWTRLFFRPIHAIENIQYLGIGGAVVFTYSVLCSKAYIIIFIYKCKIMKNAFATWNERLEMVLHKGEGNKTRNDQCLNRTGFDHLFRDYAVLLDLLRGMDTMFSNIIESYYATQVFSVCFEIYYFVSTFISQDEFKGARKLDGILMGLHLFGTLIMLFLSSTAAAEVGEVAMYGLEIIRRKGFIGRKSNEEMYFTLSIFMSYTGHFETALTGGRYMVLDKEFLVSLVGTIFSYFIILTQFTPPLAMLDQTKLERFNPKDLILHVERTYQWFNSIEVGFDTMRNFSQY